MGQESHRIIGWKQRKTDQVSKDDQHKEVIQMSSLLLHFQIHLMEHQSIDDLPDHFRRAFQFRREREK